MRFILILLFFFSCLGSFSQTKDTLKKQSGNTTDIITFITRLDITNATKDGIYLNGYVVNINYEQAKKLNGKKIRVTGKVTVVKGVKNRPGDAIQQGREIDARHIGSPKIEIISN